MLFLVAFALASHATVLLYEPFDYAANPGDDVSENSGGIYTDQDNDGVDFSAGLTFGELEVAGLSAHPSSSYTGVKRDLANNESFESEGAYYMSALFRANTGGNNLGGIQVGVSLSRSGEHNQRGLSFGIMGGNSSGDADELHAYMGFNRMQDGSTDPDWLLGSSDLTDGEVYLMIAKFEVLNAAADQAALSLAVYSDPASVPSSEPASWNTLNAVNISYAWPVTESDALDTMLVYRGFNTRNDASTGVDEIRMGTTYGDALPFQVPEPTSVALVSFGLFLLRIWHQRMG